MLTETSNVPSSKADGDGRAIPAVTRVPSFASGRTVVAARARTRLVCPACDPDLRGDSHRPARPATREPDRCDSCGSGLLPRRSDEPQCFAARLARFRRRIPAIRRAATALHLPYRAVDATGDPDTCLQGVTMALAATEPLAHLFASRREHL